MMQAMRARHALALALVALVALALLLALRRPHRLPHEAYIWQTHWQEPLRQSIRSNADLFQAWRVLATHIGVYGNVQAVAYDAAALRAAGRPVVVVVRIEEQRYTLDAPALINTLRDTLARARAQSLPLSGIEIDYDCPTAGLARYTQILTAVRSALGKDLRLSITTLPTWVTSRDLRTLLAQTDEAVLQVHAVRNPQGGLFNADLAHTWAEQFAQATDHPFRIALPTYGSQIGFDAFGNPTSIESEAPLYGSSAQHQELVVAPQAVRGLIDRLERDAPPHLAGFIWFRLPTQADRRAWREATLRAVVLDRPLASPVQALSLPGQDPMLFDLAVRNTGNVDTAQPSRILLPHTCHLADGASGYTAVAGKHDNIRLIREQLALLRPNEQIIVGWARCTQAPGPQLELQP